MPEGGVFTVYVLGTDKTVIITNIFFDLLFSSHPAYLLADDDQPLV